MSGIKQQPGYGIFLVVTFYVLLIENAHRAYLAYSHEAGMFFLFPLVAAGLRWGNSRPFVVGSLCRI